MATQNAYNNYIKRKTQTTQPINNFKEKVKNSLGGVATNNTYSTKPTTNPTTPNISHSKPIGAYSNTNTSQTTTNAPTTPTTPQNTIPTTPQTIQQPITTTQPTQPTTDVNTQATGLMSLSDINNSFNTPQNPITNQQTYSTNKTVQQQAQELLDEQKAQLQKDWELKQKEIALQKEQAQNSFNQSVTDANNAYNESIE